jgi:hypothetical protein
LVPGCAHASVSVLRDGKFVTLASDDVARRIDALEREVREGPCLDAILEERPQHDPDITAHATWPELARRALAETPVRSMLAFRLINEGAKSAALNLVRDEDLNFLCLVKGTATNTSTAIADGSCTTDSTRARR